MNKTLVFLLIIACLYIGWSVGHGSVETECVTVSDTVVVRDTVRVGNPVAVDSSFTRFVTTKLPVSLQSSNKYYNSDYNLTKNLPILSNSSKIGEDGDDGKRNSDITDLRNWGDGDLVCKKDSAEVVVPITQKVYRDSAYTAYVSGYMPSLDSLVMFPQRVTVRSVFKPPEKGRWSVGIQVGYGIGLGGSPRVEPYIGLGVQYNLLSF